MGYGLELHYCLGQITDVNVAWLDTSCACDDAHEKAVSNCCDEKEFFVQVKDEHQSTSIFETLDIKLFVTEITWDTKSTESAEELKRIYPKNTGPPIFLDLFKENCAFIFYG